MNRPPEDDPRAGVEAYGGRGRGVGSPVVDEFQVKRRTSSGQGDPGGRDVRGSWKTPPAPMRTGLLVACLFWLGSQVSWLGGLRAIMRRRVRRHRTRMLVGLGLLAGGLVTFWGPRLAFGVAYRGPFQGAYGLLTSLQVGLSGGSLLLAALAIWAMWEEVWDLHRRAGMFAFVSGFFASVSGEVLAAFLVWT